MTTTAVSNQCVNFLSRSGGDTTTTSGDAIVDSGGDECGRRSGGTEHAIQMKDHPEMNQNCRDDSKGHSTCHLVEYIYVLNKYIYVYTCMEYRG